MQNYLQNLFVRVHFDIRQPVQDGKQHMNVQKWRHFLCQIELWYEGNETEKTMNSV